MIILRDKLFVRGLSRKIKKAGKIMNYYLYKAKNGANDLAWKLELNPQETIKQGAKLATEKAANYPLVAIGKTTGIPISSAVGYAVGGTEGALWANASPVGVGTLIASSEPLVRKTFPKYAIKTDKMAEAVHNSKSYDQFLDGVVGRNPAVTFQNSGPNATLPERLKYNINSGFADISNGVQGLVKSTFSEKQFMTPMVARVITSKPGKAVMNKLIPLAKKIDRVAEKIKVDPEGALGEGISSEIRRASYSPGSTFLRYSPMPGSISTSVALKPYETRGWDIINNIGVGNYNIGTISQPVKRVMRGEGTNNFIVGATRGVVGSAKLLA